MRSTRVSLSDQELPPIVTSPTKRQNVRKVCVVGECNDSTSIDLLQTEYEVEVVRSVDGKDYIDLCPEELPPIVTSTTKRQNVRKVCVVGECNDSAAIDLLHTEYEVEVVRSVDGKNYIDQCAEFVFLSESFHSSVFLGLFKESGVRFISPTYVRSRYRKHVELVMPRANRPLYCELLKDHTLVMANIPNKVDIANIAHFLNANIRKEVNERATHVIATSVHCKQYRMAYSMGLPILRPEYVRHIWNKRDELDYDVTNRDIMLSFRLQAFEGLKIAFIAFKGEDIIDMERQVKKYKGEVVKDERLATHVVFNAKGTELPKVELQQGQYHITSEWFWNSVQMEGCADETTYLIRQAPTNNTFKGIGSPMKSVQQNERQTRSTTSVLDSSDSCGLTDEYSSDELDKVCPPSPRRIDKRHQVCMEMLETEQNYLKALGLVMKFKDALEGDSAKGGEGVIPKDDIVIIFAKFDKIIKVHSEICAKLTELIEEWRPENEVGKVNKGQAWIEAQSQLEAAYPPFINSYDTIKNTMDNLNMTNQRFHVFLKAQEASPELHRNTMRDLMIRPVQRLPSVLLLLKEIDKRTDSKLADKESLKKAVQTINSILEKANTRRAMNDEHSKLFLICNQIDNIPASIYCANRQHVMDLESECLGGSGIWKNHAKETLRFFLFNDILEITKVRRLARESVSGTGSISRLTRAFSFSPPSKMRNRQSGPWGGEAKLYKHKADILLTSLRQMYYVFAGDHRLLVLVICRDTEDDEELVLLPSDELGETTREFQCALSHCVYLQCGRDVSPTRMEVEETSPAVQDIVKKIVYKRGRLSSTNGSMLLPQEMDDNMMQQSLDNTSNTSFSRGGFRSSVTQLVRGIFRRPSLASTEDLLRRLDNDDDDSILEDDIQGSFYMAGSSRALSNTSLMISNKHHVSKANLRSIHDQTEGSPAVLPRSDASSTSPADRGADGHVYSPTSRYGSIRSLFPFTSASSVKRREKKNNSMPEHRLSTQSTFF